MLTKIGEEFCFPDHIPPVHSRDKIQTLPAVVVEMISCKLLQLCVASYKDCIFICRHKLQLCEKGKAEGFLIEPVAKQRPDLPVGFFRFGASGIDFFKPQ